MNMQKKTPHDTVRAFIAIELSEDARQGLAMLQDRLRGILPPDTVRWAAATNIHLTLHFLGDLRRNHLETVERILLDAAGRSSPFSLTLAGLGCFPNPRRPRIVWVGISGETEPLRLLHKRLGKDLKKSIGFHPEPRPFSPHLTIGRVKKALRTQPSVRLGSLLEQQFDTVGDLAVLKVDKILLIQSDLRPDGPVYTSLAQAELG